jgi:hypothetical protein
VTAEEARQDPPSSQAPGVAVEGARGAPVAGAAVAGSPRALPWLALLLAVATGVYGAFFWLTVDPGPPPEAFAPAARVLRAGHREGDLILLVPFYATRAREHLGDLEPLAVRDPLAEDFERHPRVWVFGLFGEAERLRPGFAALGLTLLESAAPSPGITVDLYQTPAPRAVVFDFVRELRRAKVWHEKDGQRVPCSEWQPLDGQGGPSGRWACPYDREWFYVAPEYHRMGDHLRFCLWAHPPGQGRLVISYPGVPLGPTLVGRAGHTLNSSVHAREAVSLDVAVAEAPPQRFRFALTEHYRPFRLDLSEVATATRTATVTFAVSTPDAGANHFCFSADLRAAARTAEGR